MCPECCVKDVPGMYQKWWRGKDSNLRRQSRQIYSLIPLTAREPLHRFSKLLVFYYTGAGNRSRTCDLLITNQLLYQLSYAGTFGLKTKTLFINGSGLTCRVF